ncbi:MAG: hypothetical protein WC931_02185 [Bacilli bacterium]
MKRKRGGTGEADPWRAVFDGVRGGGGGAEVPRPPAAGAPGADHEARGARGERRSP